MITFGNSGANQQGVNPLNTPPISGVTGRTNVS